MSSYQLEFENFQTQTQHWEDHNEKLEEALSFSDLPIVTTSEGNNEEGGAKEENDNGGDNDNSEFNFDFGSLVGSVRSLEGEMCAADEVFSGGQLLPYRNSVSSMSGLRSVSVSDPDRRRFGSRSSSSRSSSVRSHYSTTSSSGSGGGGGGSSSCSSISAKTFPLVSKSSKVVQNQNQFHSYPSPKPQILGPGARYSTYAASPAVKKSKMWEVLKLGLVRTPEIELQGLKLRCNNHHRTNNFGNKTTFMIPRNNSTGSNSSSSSNKGGNNNNDDRARKSFSGNGGKISEFFMLEMQRGKNNQSSEIVQKTGKGGFFKSCKCTIGVIEPMPVVRSNKFGKGQNVQPVASQVRDEDKNTMKHQLIEEQKQQQQQKQKEKQQQKQHQQRRNDEIRQGEQVMSHHHHHHHHRTFEWLKNLSHASNS